MLNKENVREYLNAVSATRKVFIAFFKGCIYAYKDSLSKISVDYAVSVPDDYDMSELDKLKTITINPEVFDLLDESEYNVGIAFDDERWERKWIVIDGITLEALDFKGDKAVQDA